MPDRLVSKLHTKTLLNDLYSEDNASRCSCAHPHPCMSTWLVVSLINQVGSRYALIMFSVSFLIAGLP